MGMRINQNIMALTAYRNLSKSDESLQMGLEKLSSGFRINRAADDASGLVISENLRSQIGGLNQATRNAQDGINVVQTAEGALNEVQSILQRMRDLAVQASNTGSSDVAARTAAQQEVAALSSELDRISASTKFGKTALLDGTFGLSYASTAANLNLVGTGLVITATTGQAFSITVNGVTAAVTVAVGTYTTSASLQSALDTAVRAGLSAVGQDPAAVKVNVTDPGGYGVVRVNFSSSSAYTLTAGTGAADFLAQGAVTAGAAATAGTGGVFQVGANNVATDRISVAIGSVSSSGLSLTGLDVINGANAAITSLDAAITSVTSTRGALGAYQNRFQHTINNLNVSVQNLTASESQIRDTDMAQEMVRFTRDQILVQAGTAMLAQANAAPQSVLKLLQ